MKIEGFFIGVKNANSAVEKLKSEGFSKACTDLNDHYSLDNQPGPKVYSFFPTTNLSDLVLNSGNPGGTTGKSPLLAASPMVSGMGDFEEITDVNYKVIVDDIPENYEKIKNIIESFGGTTSNPNNNIQERIQSVNLSEIE